VTAIHQFVPTLAPRDAVGTHYLAIQATLRDAGYASDIYAFEAKDEFRKRARPYRDYRGGKRGEETWLLYHSSVGSPVAEFVMTRAEPLLVDYHNITPPSFFLRWEPYVVGQLQLGRRQLATLAPRCRLGLADSAFNASELEAMGCPRTDVLPIMLDIATLDRRPDPLVAAQVEAARGRSAQWLFVGRIAPNKAQHDLIKAFAAYREYFDGDARLRLVGGSSSHAYETALRAFVDALGLGGAVEFTGPVSDGALAAYYERSDVLVVCSEHEGFLVPLLEAMHHGLPVVAYASSAVPETLGDAGLLLDSKRPVPVAAAVDRVLHDDALRSAMIAAGKARLAHFDISRTRQKLLDVVAAVVGSP
jgi:glycosyltransferase involved in cell wall biosynthesis